MYKIAKYILNSIIIPLGAIELLKHLVAETGYYKNPSDGLGKLVAFLTPVMEASWLQPLVFFLLGAVVATYGNELLRRFDGSRSGHLRTVGYELIELGERISERQHRLLSEWPSNVSDLVPQILSMSIKLKQANIWHPGSGVLDIRAPDFPIQFMTIVGRLLADGHFREARAAALDAKHSFDEEVKRQARKE